MEQLLDAAGISGGPDVTRDERVSAEQMAAYIDGRLEDSERARVEAILARDKALRDELVDASRIIAAAPALGQTGNPRFRISWKAVTLLAAAAALAIVVAPSRLSRRAGSANTTVPAASERKVNADGALAITVIAPEATRLASPDAISFSWHSVPGATYRLIVTDSAGVTVFQKNTSDTLVTAEVNSGLRFNSQYYWYVDALLTDGSSISSGPRSFSTRGP